MSVMEKKKFPMMMSVSLLHHSAVPSVQNSSISSFFAASSPSSPTSPDAASTLASPCHLLQIVVATNLSVVWGSSLAATHATWSDREAKADMPSRLLEGATRSLCAVLAHLLELADAVSTTTIAIIKFEAISIVVTVTAVIAVGAATAEVDVDSVAFIAHLRFVSSYSDVGRDSGNNGSGSDSDGDGFEIEDRDGGGRDNNPPTTDRGSPPPPATDEYSPARRQIRGTDEETNPSSM
ncbi:hypothetical protein EGR_03143 [Echinococcus granulosus]|uniref:Uncharacterized protein n=1 Tax=Echinococcus granulosus TaxID=6210 RepID=W6UJZ3_ECHGR|nr:hypothetical protein EGR_03143 [Echinococcus granulosus]EUB61870.1 hypothetical protein EGR_03143 [Echinococcus granulosus]